MSRNVNRRELNAKIRALEDEIQRIKVKFRD
jgi:hypothetical protein